MTTEQPELRMLVGIERPQHSSDDTFWIVARPVQIVVEDGAERVRNVNDRTYDPNPLADLSVRVMVDAERWYSNETEYREVFVVDEARARAMAKLLSKVRRGLERLEREFGFAENYAQYLARVASVLGISSFGLRTSQDTGWYDRNTYRWVDATYLREIIDTLVAEQRKALAR